MSTANDNALMHIKSTRHSYPVYCFSSSLPLFLAKLKIYQKEQNISKIAIISDSNVGAIYVPELLRLAEQQQLQISYYEVPAGEASKNMTQVSNLCQQLAINQFDRHSLLVALGGGVVGDLVGFTAAIYMRGISFIQVPTTIVAQVDSSIGGKTGVNLAEGKNLVGVFYPPAMVWIDSHTLQTLDNRVFAAGCAEMLKHALIADGDFWQQLTSQPLTKNNISTAIIRRNLEIKAEIVEVDEQEKTGRRALLNFGHTVGHAIEASLPYGKILHGDAVAIGMHAALLISAYRGHLTLEQVEVICDKITACQLPIMLQEEVSTELILQQLQRDKKWQNKQLAFILLQDVGQAYIDCHVPFAIIQRSVEIIQGKYSAETIFEVII